MSLTDLEINKILFRDDLDGEESMDSVPKLNRKVCSIESALNPDKYNLLPMDEEEIRFTSVLAKKTRIAPAKNILWTNIPPPSSRETAENILLAQPLVNCR